MSENRFQGAVFDLDGVIVETSYPHFKAWKLTFDDFLTDYYKKLGKPLLPFTFYDDFIPYVQGKSRVLGVESFLDSRGIHIDKGKPDDSPGLQSIYGISNLKNQQFLELLKEEGVRVYENTLRFIHILKERDIKIGVSSISKNTQLVLKYAGLEDLFDGIVDGHDMEEKNLKTPPEPDLYIEVARKVGLFPNQCLMVEDAITGVAAGRNGNFAMVIGLSRSANKYILRNFGGDLAVEDLSHITWDDIDTWFKTGVEKDGWSIDYYGFDQEHEKLRETLTTVGNGYFATRGCFVGEQANKDIHYPGTYIAGLFNRVPTVIHDKKIYNTDFVNCPNWTMMEISIGGSNYIDILKTEIQEYKHWLDLRNAIMHRMIKFRDARGRITTIETERFASMSDPHYGLIRYKVTPHNYYEKVSIRSTIDGTVINSGVPRYRSLSSNHLNSVNEETPDNQIFLHVKTNQSQVDIFMNAKHKVSQNGDDVDVERERSVQLEKVSETITLNARQATTYVIDKFVSLYTSGDWDVESAETASRKALNDLSNYEEMLEAHKQAWQKLWDETNIKVDGDRFSQKTLRLHTYHLLVTASIHNKHIDAGMPARGLHGEAYRGHIFWDELYILPFYNLHFPDVARSLLMYRYRRLDAAREYARENGYRGAMYPWQSADTGEEETQEVHYNPVSGRWGPDLSRLQRHVSIAIAYNFLEYFRSSLDYDFLHNYGMEVILEIARFWASIAKKEQDGKYHIRKVMGPDEFHEKYPNAEKGGLNDNAYTNIMVSWLINKTLQTFDRLPGTVRKQLKGRIDLKNEELEEWKDVMEKLYVSFSDQEVIEQFQGFFDLEELDFDHYKKKYGQIERMDRILKSENDSPNKYKAIKQADTMMLFYNLSPTQVKHVLERLGYGVGNEYELFRKNFRYYIERTTHGSTLSYVVHSAILKYMRGDKSREIKTDIWKWFSNALKSDIFDSQGGTTAESIHAGLMAGTIGITYATFAGIRYFKDHIILEPNLPNHWCSLEFRLTYRGNKFRITIDKKNISIDAIELADPEFAFEIDDTFHYFKGKHKLEVSYSKESKN
ncbi:MAG: HAD-IA family hydrolase [Bacteroidales bacterium]|nr:HAD-IA family hydrolase [Bacteroidales bacterium]